MKKKILFIMPHMKIGGVDKALASLLSCIDYNKYIIDLVILDYNNSTLLNDIPEKVNIIKLDDIDRSYAKAFFLRFIDSCKLLLNNKEYRILAKKIILCTSSKIGRKKNIDQELWKNIRNYIDCLNTKYDAAIAYITGLPLYFLNEKVTAKKKLCFIHFDYSKKYINNESVEINNFLEMDKIICVSRSVKDIFIQRFPKIEERTVVQENIVSSSLISSKANEVIDIDKFYIDKNSIMIVTVGRIEYIKGIDIALDACELLVKDNLNIKWFVIGDGQEYFTIKRLIMKKRLNNNFILLGSLLNPYNWISKADIYVQPSRSEAKSIAITEAQILQKPVIATRTSSIHEQINDGINGYIVDPTASSISEGIKKCIKNKLIISNSTHLHNTNRLLHSFYKLIN